VLTIGIDPGSAGGIAVLDGAGVWDTFAMPEDAKLVEILRGFCTEHESQVFIEQIPKYCGAARFAERNIMGSSLAVLYGNYKFCCGVVHGLGITPRLLAPLRWQNLVACRNHERLERGEWKRKLKARAQELFPGVRVTLATADALLIAHAGELLTQVELT
jgi:hypothetical protein